MNIDIIDFTDEQFAALDSEQIEQVREAQVKKERLLSSLAEKKEKEKYRLIKNGIFRSEIYSLVCTKLEQKYAREVEDVKDSLLFYLRFTARQEDQPQVDYTVDYALPYAERYAVVKDYYDEHYPSPRNKYDAFLQDRFLIRYLGEYYSVLYDLYLLQLPSEEED